MFATPKKTVEHTDRNEQRSTASTAKQTGSFNEQEAAQPLRMPALIQRKCAHCEEEEAIHRKALTSYLQKKGEATGEVADAGITSKIEASRGGGAALGGETKSFMESRFNTDFSEVRIHTNSQAVQLSGELHAQAFTVGNDIYFNEGKFNPATSEGKQLLAHELTHTIQQSGDARKKSIQRLVFDSHVQTTPAILASLGLTRQQVIDTITAADADAIVLAQGAEDALTNQLANAIAGAAVDPAMQLALNEELGLSFNNPAHRNLIRQQIRRFRTVRETLESGFLRYFALGGTRFPLVGCTEPGSCTDAFAFTCPGNRLMVLCQAFWDTPAEQSSTILHEPFHIWFHMARHEENALRRSDASCFESFALCVAGRNAPASCVAHTAG